MRIDPRSHVPIFVQIADRIKESIAAGVYRADEALPSIRELAVKVRVNPNTVRRAYETLERDGMIHPRRGLGMFVAKRGPRWAQAQAARRVSDALVRAVETGRAAEMSDAELRRLFKKAMHRPLQQASRR